VPKKALIADDDPAILQLIERWMRGSGYEVRTFANFGAARRGLDEWRPDVLIADVRLGDFNGLQLVIHARADNPSISAVVVSGFDDIVLRGECTAVGAAYLLKPLRLEALLEAIG
jgi:DNA-binding response OmpR family regulator